MPFKVKKQNYGKLIHFPHAVTLVVPSGNIHAFGWLSNTKDTQEEFIKFHDTGKNITRQMLFLSLWQSTVIYEERMCKLETSCVLKYGKESSRGNGFKYEMFPQSILSESWFIKYTGKSHFLRWSAA